MRHEWLDLFLHFLDTHFDGNKKLRPAQLSLEVKAFYLEKKTDACISALTEAMIRQSSTRSPELQTRALIPFSYFVEVAGLFWRIGGCNLAQQ